MSKNMILVGLTPDPENLEQIQDKKIVEIRFGHLRWGAFETDESTAKKEGFTPEELLNFMKKFSCSYGFELIYDDDKK
jgi:hypothetical protein